MAQLRLTVSDLRMIADAVGHAVDDLHATIQDEPTGEPHNDHRAAHLRDWEHVRRKVLLILKQRRA